MIERKEVRTYTEYAICEKDYCGAIMKPTGECLMSDPPQFPHTCVECGNTQNFRVRYPNIVYEES